MPRKRAPDMTRTKILNSALKAFAEKGYARASMDEIAEGAGVTKGALYWHFDDKLKLYRSLVDHVLEMQTVAVMPSLDAGKPAHEMVSELVHSYLSFYRENGLVMAFYSNMMMEVKTLSETGIMAAMADVYREYRRAVASALRKGGRRGARDHEARASVLIGALDGLVMQWMLDPEGFDPDPVGEALVELYSTS